LQGWLLCVGFVCLANVPDLVRRIFVDKLFTKFFGIQFCFLFLSKYDKS
jgi:hypothetical protein